MVSFPTTLEVDVQNPKDGLGSRSIRRDSEFVFFFARDGNKQGLTEFLHAEVADHVLGFRRDHEIGEGFSSDGIDAWTVGAIHFHDGVDVQECSVGLD